MIWNGELHQSVVCSGFLLVNLVCNTFLVSVCVRSSVLQSGVHRFVLLSPRVILVGTVLRAAASLREKSVPTLRISASISDVAAAAWVAGYHPRQPSQVVSELYRGTPSTGDEWCRGVSKDARED